MISVTLNCSDCNRLFAFSVSKIIDHIISRFPDADGKTIEEEASIELQKEYDHFIDRLDFNSILPQPDGRSDDWIRYGHYTKIIRCDDYKLKIKIQRIMQKSEHKSHSVFLSPILPFISVTADTVILMACSSNPHSEISQSLFRTVRKYFNGIRKIIKNMPNDKNLMPLYRSLIRKRHDKKRFIFLEGITNMGMHDIS